MKIVIELIFIAILAASVWVGYKKGLVMTAGSILIIIISLFVGDLLSDTFAHEAVPALRPFVAGYMEGTEGAIGTALLDVTGSATGMLSADDVIELRPELTIRLCQKSYENLGIFSAVAEEMAQQAEEFHSQTGEPISSCIVEIMCRGLTYFLGFLLFFAVSVILLTVLGNISNLSFKIPNAEKLNTFGGAGAGLVVGILYCALFAWVLHFTGKLMPEDELGGLIGKLFVNMNIFSNFLSI